MIRSAVRGVTGAAVDSSRGGLALAEAGGGGATERVQNGDFASDTGWDTTGLSWTIAAGAATNNTAGMRIVNTLSSALVGGEDFDFSFDVVGNPANTGLVVSLYNSATTAAQTIFSDGTTTGTKTSSGTASGPFDQLRIGASDDPGAVIDNVSLIA